MGQQYGFDLLVSGKGSNLIEEERPLTTRIQEKRRQATDIQRAKPREMPESHQV